MTEYIALLLYMLARTHDELYVVAIEDAMKEFLCSA